MTVAHVLITGDSHTAAVKRGLNLLEAEGGIPEDFEIELDRQFEESQDSLRQIREMENDNPLRPQER